MESSGSIQRTTAELAKVAAVVADKAQHASLKEDPRGTLEKAGVNMNMVPESIVTALRDMTPDQLDALSRFNQALIDAGFVIGAPDDVGWGRVGFF
jgi:hypothetical protein